MNRPRHRARSFVSATLALALVLAMPLSAPGGGAPVGDDEIPGVAIPASPFDDALDGTTDPDDVFAVPLKAGESFTATLTGAAGTDFDIALFSPDATSVLGPTPPVAENPIASYPETFTYTVTTTGTYYFDVTVPISGTGTYTAEWATATVEPPVPPVDDNISGATTLPASPAVGTLNDVTDLDDVYKVHLSPGQKIDATLSWTDPNPDAAFQLFLFEPTATDINTDVPVAASLPNEKPATVSYIARVEGDYYLDAYALLGTGAYSLNYTITAAPAPDGNNDIPSAVTMPAAPVSGALTPGSDDHDVYTIDMIQGQVLSVSLNGIGSPTPEFFADLYPPGSGSISTALPVATANPDTFEYTAPVTGRYYLDVSTVDSVGNYQLIWTLAAPIVPPPPGGNGTSSAMPLPSSPVIGTLDSLGKADDVYKVPLLPGQKIDVTLNWADAPDTAFRVLLFAPGATDTITDVPLVSSALGVRPAVISYTAATGGDYYLNARALLGAGAYSLAYAITYASDNDISTAATLPPNPVSGTLAAGSDDHDVYGIDLVAGQVLTVTLNSIGSPAPKFFAKLYPPGSGSLSTALPVATANPDTFEYTAPATGRYYLDVSTVDGSGTYELIWTLRRSNTAIASSLATKVAWGKGAALTATLTAGSNALGGRIVRVEAKRYDALAFSKLKDIVTNGSGLATTTVYPTERTQYRVVYDGDADYSGSTGATRTIIPYAYLSRPYAVRSVYAVGQRFTAYGSLKPRHPAGARSVRIFAARYERQWNGTYKWVVRRTFYPKNVNYSGYTRFTTTASLPWRGRWRLIARIPGDRIHTTTYSTPRYLTVK